MKQLLGNFVWEILSTDEFPTEKDGAKDGHLLKVIDGGEGYLRRGGKWVTINLGLSFVKATKSGKITTDADGYAHVTYKTPFSHNEYSITLTAAASPWPYMCSYAELTDTGFDIYTRDTRNGAAAGNKEVSWQCTIDYNP